jgi:hypothetical protein
MPVASLNQQGRNKWGHQKTSLQKRCETGQRIAKLDQRAHVCPSFLDVTELLVVSRCLGAHGHFSLAKLFPFSKTEAL